MAGILRQISRSNGGIPKLPVSGAVLLSKTSVEGDRCRNLRYHGGPDQAVLMVSAEFIDDLAARGFPVYYGALGENLTVSGLEPGAWRRGQRYRIGADALIELTKLRVPCRTLDVFGPAIKSELYDSACKAGDPSSVRWARGGIYARVIRPGLIAPGDTVAPESGKE